MESQIMKMRRSTSGQHTVALLTASSSLFVPFDGSRVTLVIGATLNDTVLLSLREAAVGGVGLRLAPGAGVLVLTMAQHGQMVCGPIFARMAAGDETITYWETSHHGD